MSIRIVSSAYVLPSVSLSLQDVFSSEKLRIEAALKPLSASLRTRVMENLGVERVRACIQEQPFDLALKVASQAIEQAGIRPGDVDLIVDFVTLPGNDQPHVPFAQRLDSALGIESRLNISYRIGGCAGLHVAIKNACALMNTDEDLNTALLITADTPPEGSRTLLPIAVQGDAGSAVVIMKDNRNRPLIGPEILRTGIQTLGHLHDVITLQSDPAEPDRLQLRVDPVRIENDLMPVYYLNFYRLIYDTLDKTGINLDDISLFVYSNISRTDYDSFIKALNLPIEKVAPSRISDLGHTFASDLIINYSDYCRAHSISPGQYILFASAGIGFTWGVTIAQA